MLRKETSLVVLAFSLLSSAVWADVKAIDVDAKPIVGFDLQKPSRKQFGALEFIGGLVLRSSYKHFGALSGLRIVKGNELTAVADTGFWFSAKIERNENDEPIGFSESKVAPILDEEGNAFTQKWFSDAEGLTFRDNMAFISTEQYARILMIPINEQMLTTPAKPAIVNFPGERIRYSFGLEAIATMPSNHQYGGWLLALTEGTRNADGNFRAFLVENERNILELSVKPKDNFSITDADFLPNGDLLLLERRYSMAKGPEMRLRQIDGATISKGAVLDGKIIMAADLHQQIDNMEGLSVFRGSQGETRIALVSDNNHWLLQRTLYLEFRLR